MQQALLTSHRLFSSPCSASNQSSPTPSLVPSSKRSSDFWSTSPACSYDKFLSLVTIFCGPVFIDTVGKRLLECATTADQTRVIPSIHSGDSPTLSTRCLHSNTPLSRLSLRSSGSLHICAAWKTNVHSGVRSCKAPTLPTLSYKLSWISPWQRQQVQELIGPQRQTQIVLWFFALTLQ